MSGFESFLVCYAGLWVAGGLLLAVGYGGQALIDRGRRRRAAGAGRATGS